MAKQLNVDMRFTADTSKAKQAINDLEQSLQKLGHSSMPANAGIDPAQFEKASAAARELEFHLKNAYNAKTGNLDLSKLSSSLKASNTNLDKLVSNFGNAGSLGKEAFVKLARAIALADQPSLTLGTHLNALLVTLKNVARFQLSSSIMHGLIGGIQSAYGYAQDLNKSLNNIRIVTGQSTEQMARFAEQANKGAKALSATTLDYTDAALIYYQQGLSNEEVVERTETTLKLANVSRQSAEEVSDQMTAIWNNFADGSHNLEYYADVITALGAATASSSQEIAGGLEKFASVAQTVGLSYEYAASALATIVAQTRQSEDTVGTGLRTLFARFEGLKLGETLEDGVDLNKYSKALQSIGVNILDANGNLREMDDILDDMGEKWDTLTQAQKVALAQTVGGVRQYTNLIALMDNWDTFQENLKAAQNSEGVLQKQADIYAESWEAAKDRVKAAIEDLFSTLLHDDFFISITNTVESIISSISRFIKSLGGVKSLITGVLGFVISSISTKIGPAIRKIGQDIQILSGGAEKVYKNMQKEFNTTTNKALNDSQYTNDPMIAASLKGSQNLLAAKTKLSAINDKLSNQEKMYYELTISGFEIQAEQNIKLAEEVVKAKEKEKEANQKMTEAIEEADKAAIIYHKNFMEKQQEVIKATKELNKLLEEQQQIKNTVESNGNLLKANAKRANLNNDIAQNTATKNFSNITAIQTNLTTEIQNLDSIGPVSEEEALHIENLNNQLNKLNDIISNNNLEIFNQKMKETATAIRSDLADAIVSGNQDLVNFQNIFNSLLSRQGEGNFKIISSGDELIDNAALEAVKTRLMLFKETFSDFIFSTTEESERVKEAFNSVFNALKEGNIDDYNNSFQILRQILQDLAIPADKAEKAFKALGGSTKVLSNFTKVKKQQIEVDTKAKKAGEQVVKIKNKEIAGEKQLTKATEKAEQTVKNYTKAKEEVKEKTDALTKSEQDLQDKINKFNPQPMITLSATLSKLASGFMGLGMAVNSFKSLTDAIFSTEDITAGERFIQIFMALGMLIPSLSNAFQAVNAAKAFYNTLTAASILVNQADVNLSTTKLGLTVTQNTLEAIKGKNISKENALLAVNNVLNLLKGKTIDQQLTSEGALVLTEEEKIAVEQTANVLTGAQLALMALKIAFSSKEQKATQKLILVEILKKKWGDANLKTKILTLLAEKQYATVAIVAAAAVALGVVAIVAATKASKARTEALKEQNEAENEMAKKTKETAEQNKELVQSFRKLYQAYKEAKEKGEDVTEIQNQLAESAKKLKNSYDIQGAALAELTGNYDAYAESVRKARLEELQLMQIQLDRSNKLNNLIAGYNNFFSGEKISGKSFGFLEGPGGVNLSKAVNLSKYSYLKPKEGLIQKLSLEDMNTNQDFVLAYEELQDYLVQLEKIYGKQAQSMDVYKNISAYLMGNQKKYEALSEQVYNNLANSIEQADLSGVYIEELGKKITSNEVDTLEEYQNYRQQLLKSLAESKGIIDENGYIIAGQEAAWNALNEQVDKYLGSLENVSDFVKQDQAIKDFNSIAFQHIKKEKGSSPFTIGKVVKKYNIQEFARSQAAAEADDQTGEDWEKLYSEYLNLALQINPYIDPDDWPKQFEILQNQANQSRLKIQIELVESGKELNKKSDATAQEWSDWINQFIEEEQQKLFELAGVEDFYSFLMLPEDKRRLILSQFEALLEDERKAEREHQVKAEEEFLAGHKGYAEGQVEDKTNFFNSSMQSRAYNNAAINNNGVVTRASYAEALQQEANKGQKILDDFALGNEALFDAEHGEGSYQRYSENPELLAQIQRDVDEANAEANEILNTIALITEYQTDIAKLTNESDAEKALEEYEKIVAKIKNFDLDVEEIKNYADYLKTYIPNGADMSAEALMELALKQKLLERGFKNLSEETENFYNLLENDPGGSEFSISLKKMQDSVMDILGLSSEEIDGTIFDSKFFDDNREAIEKAIQGDLEAIEKLQTAVAQQVAVHLIDPEKVDDDGVQVLSKVNKIIGDMQAAIPDDIEIGMSIGDINGMEPYLNSLQAMLDAGELTAEQVNAVLESIGFDPQIDYIPIEAVQNSTAWVNGEQEVDFGGEKVKITQEAYNTAVMEGKTSIPVINAKSTTSTSAPKIGGSKSGGGGGGGGGKSSTKEKKNPTDERDRYHTITQKIQDATDAYDELSKAEDRAFGKERIKAMEGITNNLKLQIELQKQYLDEIRNYLEGDRAAVEALGATFDANGVITNYDDLIAELVAKYNEGVDAFNNGGLDEDAFKEQYEKPFNDAKEAISQYVETINLLQSEELNLIGLQNDLADQFREIAAYKLELHIDIDEDELKYLDFLLEILGENAEDAVDRLDLLGQQFNTNRDEIAAYTTAIQDLLRLRGFTDEDVAAFIRGELTAGDLEERGFTTDDIDKLREYRDAIQDNTTAMNDLAKEIEESFLNTLDDLNEKVDDAEERFEHFATMLEHFHNVVDIVGQDALGMSAETMKLLAKAAKENAIEMVKAAKTQLDSLNTVRAQAQAQLDVALEAQKNASTAEEKLRAEEAVRYWSDTISEVTNRVEQAEEDLADALENALEGIQEMYTTMIEQATKEFEHSVTGAAGSLEQLQNNFDRQKETQELYIPTYEKIYELTKLTRDINNSIDDTDNLWSKQELAKLQDEINQKMEDGVKLTEHDVEELRKRYELKLAEAALEEAQDAKRTVRMSRDNEGNWSYVYTADENDVAAAEQSYEDKLYEYQQMNYEYIQELQGNIIQAEQDMTDQINDLDVTKFASKEAYLAEVQRIMDATQAKEQQYKDQLAQTLDQQGILYEEDWKRYNELTGYRMARDDQWVDNWNETILAQQTGFETLEEMFDQLTGAIGGPDEPGTYVGDITDAYAEMQASNERALNAAGTSMQTYEQDTVDAISGIDQQMEETQNQVEEFANSMVDAMEGVSDFIGEWKNQYGEAVKSITEFNKDLYDSCNTLIKKLQDAYGVNADFEAAQAEAAAEALAGSNRGGSGGESSNNNDTPSIKNPYTQPVTPLDDGDGEDENEGEWSNIGAPEDFYQSLGKTVHQHKRRQKKGRYVKGQCVENTIDTYSVGGPEPHTTQSEQRGRSIVSYCTKCGEVLKTWNFVTPSFSDVFGPGGYKSGGYTGTWSAASARTGMYTGSWNGPDLEENGRLAFLHQKELVLNASDTENFLSAVDMVRQISQTIDLQAASRSNGWNFLLPGVLSKEPNTLDQNVHIEAHFPNVTSHSEIEEAFTNLVGKASQFANR